ncbi:MAG: hypothetical protein JW987_02220 [Anaerolineaceae bacterium]|nr:hypothetical protein [Anaerolineaceae bacterium]
MEKKFGALRVVGTLYKVLGVILLVLGILGGSIICIGGIVGSTALQDMGQQFGINPGMSIAGAVVSGVMTVLGTAIGGLTMFAFGEAVYLFLAIEENTRAAANRG